MSHGNALVCTAVYRDARPPSTAWCVRGQESEREKGRESERERGGRGSVVPYACGMWDIFVGEGACYSYVCAYFQCVSLTCMCTTHVSLPSMCTCTRYTHVTEIYLRMYTLHAICAVDGITRRHDDAVGP